MSSPLTEAFTRASPRLSPRTAPLASTLIHFTVAAMWVALFSCAFISQGLLAWSAGLAYVSYDTFLLCFVAWKSLALLRVSQDSSHAPEKLPSLGVIVAAHNEGAVLPITLRALLTQSRVPDLIVIADDGSSDTTSDVLVSQFQLPQPALGELSALSPLYPNLRWLRLPHGGKAVALNAAIALMDSEVVLTIDADTLLDTQATLAMQTAFAREAELVAAGGILTPISSKTLSGRFFQWFQTYEYIRNFVSRFAWMRVDSLLLISGAFAAFRRDALLKVGGFDAECLVEDYELIHRLRRYSVEHDLNWQVHIIGAARAVTDAPSTLMAFLRQRRRWFAGFLQTQHMNRDMTGNRKYGWLGTLMMPVKAIDTLQPVYGLTAFVLLVIFLINGRATVVLPVLFIIAVKIVIDLAFHFWSIYLYQRWTNDRSSNNLWHAFLASIAEPFSFQLMRHTGAAMGWFHFLTGRRHWGKQQRSGLLSEPTQL
ncbi:MAG TPA: glycosyltransferase family 2 protein [Rhodocyclaceae bacterium]|nr:glycosyltransferase family 2 protein [Rhodocyclaceae bacterium]